MTEKNILEDQVKELKRIEDHMRRELTSIQMLKQTSAIERENKEGDDEDKQRTKVRTASANRAKLAADQAREDETDKAEIARLMVRIQMKIVQTFLQKLLEENNKNMEDNMKEITSIKSQILRTIQAKQIATG